MEKENNKIEEIISLCKRRGFIIQSADIYNGLGSVWDFGHLGALLKNNLKDLWLKKFVQERTDVVLVESSLITKKDILAASGHEKEFSDPLVECQKCNSRFREDNLESKEICPNCQAKNSFTSAKKFNLMFKTFVGPVDSEENLAYLRPETAQGMFTNFKWLAESYRQKLPFGLAQIGKSFRNEITTGNFIFRSREFEIAEIEYFVKPGEDEKWFDFWRTEWFNFLLSLGLKKENLRQYDHPKESLAHYSKGTTDIEYNFPFGWGELTGVANRTNFDLANHEKASGQDLKYLDPETNEKFLPFVIEPTLGIERIVMAVMFEAYEKIGNKGEGGKKEESGDNNREDGEVVLHLHPQLAPIKAAVLPLVKKGGLAEIAKEIQLDLRKNWYVDYDESGSIGRRYRRQDEIGTPWCITVDFQTLDDQTVTIRDRDSMKQERVKVDEITQFLNENLDNLSLKN